MFVSKRCSWKSDRILDNNGESVAICKSPKELRCAILCYILNRIPSSVFNNETSLHIKAGNKIPDFSNLYIGSHSFVIDDNKLRWQILNGCTTSCLWFKNLSEISSRQGSQKNVSNSQEEKLKYTKPINHETYFQMTCSSTARTTLPNELDTCGDHPCSQPNPTTDNVEYKDGRDGIQPTPNSDDVKVTTQDDDNKWNSCAWHDPV